MAAINVEVHFGQWIFSDTWPTIRIASQSPLNMHTSLTVSVSNRSLTISVTDFDGIAGLSKS